jgi:hypothetical protein
MAWKRTCQECGHIQSAKEPDHTKDLTDSYRNSKCKKCKSEALDYGNDDVGDPDWEEIYK